MHEPEHGSETSHGFAAGQAWHYRSPPGFEASRLLIGAIVTFETGGVVACCAVLDAVGRDDRGQAVATTIAFVPLSLEALQQTVTAPAQPADLPEEFSAAFEAWAASPRGQTVFRVPFEGSLDRLIGLQMAAIAGVDAGSIADADASAEAERG